MQSHPTVESLVPRSAAVEVQQLAQARGAQGDRPAIEGIGLKEAGEQAFQLLRQAGVCGGLAFKEMYFRTGGKSPSFGVPAIHLVMDHFPDE